MLDSVTKKRIDDLRNILVGKIPSPQSQVEQITTGLIYKFMHDMDNEAIEMGGVPSFFIDEYEKYSWKHLFNTKLGGVEKVKLYSDAIENLYNNPNAPSIFREIFKNSFLPFKDASTFGATSETDTQKTSPKETNPKKKILRLNFMSRVEGKVSN